MFDPDRITYRIAETQAVFKIVENMPRDCWQKFHRLALVAEEIKREVHGYRPVFPGIPREHD